MKLCVYEDEGVNFLEPICLTRPAFALRCGAGTLLDRQRRLFDQPETGAWIRPELVDFARLGFPNLPLNDRAWLRSGPKVLANARWLAPLDRMTDLETPRVGMIGDQIAYVVAPSFEWADLADGVDAVLSHCREKLPTCSAGGRMIDFLWDAVDHNGEALCEDSADFRKENAVVETLPANITILGEVEDLILVEGASVEPFVTFDTRHGPIYVDRGAVIHSFSRVEGPCYIGKDNVILGAKIRAGTTLGPNCRIGGEVEASIVQGHSNKYHEGFLGHSYLGEWVNLAAATQTSDLRNDYGVVRLTVNGQRLSTGRSKIGSYIGDHTKSGLGALLNTGSVIGAFCNLLPSGTLLPQVIPSFCQVQYGQVSERHDMRQMFATAATAMQRRRVEFSDPHRDFFDHLYETTSAYRRRTIREADARRMKRKA